MPKWAHHRNIANIINIQLSAKEMREIDSKLDGLRSGYEHDFWRHDVTSLKACAQEISNKYGDNGLKYFFLHMFLDTLQASIVSERTKETPSTAALRARMLSIDYARYACQTAYRYATSTVKSYGRNLPEHLPILNQFLKDIKGKEGEIMSIVGELPEVKGQEAHIEKFKERHKRAGGIARRYATLGFDVPLYTNFILELWNTKKRGGLTKEEWGKRVLEKYKEQLKGLPEARQEKILKDFADITKRLGYASQ